MEMLPVVVPSFLQVPLLCRLGTRALSLWAHMLCLVGSLVMAVVLFLFGILALSFEVQRLCRALFSLPYLVGALAMSLRYP